MMFSFYMLSPPLQLEIWEYRLWKKVQKVFWVYFLKKDCSPKPSFLYSVSYDLLESKKIDTYA